MRNDSLAASPMTSGARASRPDAGDSPRVTTALTNASHWRWNADAYRSGNDSYISAPVWPARVRITVACCTGFSDSAMPFEPNASRRWS